MKSECCFKICFRLKVLGIGGDHLGHHVLPCGQNLRVKLFKFCKSGF